MGMAVGSPPPRAPYKTERGTMYCESCHCTYSRGSEEKGHWYRGYDRNRGKTLPMDFEARARIPDDECPMCGTKEEV
jgi:hypothetical protein